MMAPPASTFELERDRRITRNLEVLQGLGLSGAGAADAEQAKLLSTYSLPPAAPAPKRPKLVRLAEAQEAPARSSKRARGEEAPTAEEIREAVEREEQEAGAQHASQSRPLLLDDGVATLAPFSLRSIGTTVWELGAIYRGPWSYRFWSNSGCKHHHAYPVGYRASKAHFGRTWHMEIEAGPLGPIFKVTEEGTARQFIGPTPTSPWTEICVSLRTGQRISGPLFFGFSDPVTMRAIAALYTLDELLAAQQGGRVQVPKPTAAERAAEEFTSVDGIGEGIAMALATTQALGGAPHASLASLRQWAGAGANCRLLQAFLLDSDELPSATHKWPAWRLRIVPRIIRVLCGDAAADALGPPPPPPRGDAERTQARAGGRAPPRQRAGRAEAGASQGQKENQAAGAGEQAAVRAASRPGRRPAKANGRFRDFVL